MSGALQPPVDAGAYSVPTPGASQFDPTREEIILAPPPGMQAGAVQAVIDAALKEAAAYDNRLATGRAEALRQYNGEPQGDEEEGRSQVIMTEVRDTIGAMMPSVVRVFCGADHPVEFKATQERYVDQADQALDYVHHVAFIENDGFTAIHDSAMDAMQLKVGWLHWWWDNSILVSSESYTGLLKPQAEALITAPGVHAMRVVRRPATAEELAGITASPEAQVIQLDPRQPLLVYDCDITRKDRANRPRFAAFPSEQVFVDPRASGPDDARYMFFWEPATVSDLVALGFDKAVVEANVSTIMRSQNRVTRRRDRLAAQSPLTDGGDKSMRELRHWQAWLKIDFDGDGIAELRHFHGIGSISTMRVLGHEPASGMPWAPIVSGRVPHRIIGEAVADRVGDLQRINSRVVRNILDSMSESIHPRTVAVENQVNLDDVLNTELGAIIRERQPNSVRELSKPFIGPAALPILEMLMAVKEQRTGITKASQGLTADALQSTTAIAVSSQVAAAQDRIELVVRSIAEGIKLAYMGILDMLATHQDRARTVELRGRWVPVDPRPWKNAFSVLVKVGVGRGSITDRIQALSMTAGKQEQIIQTMGPNNPLVGLGQYRATLADAMQLAGIANVGRYFKPLPLDYAFPQPPPPPDPNLVLAQAEAAKVTAEADGKAADRRAKILAQFLDDSRQRDLARVSAVLDAAKINQAGGQVDAGALSRLLERQQLPPDFGAALALVAPAPTADGAEDAAQAPAGGAPGGAPGAPPGAAPSGGAPPGGVGPSGYLPPSLIQALAAEKHFAFLPGARPVTPVGTPGNLRPN